MISPDIKVKDKKEEYRASKIEIIADLPNPNAGILRMIISNSSLIRSYLIGAYDDVKFLGYDYDDLNRKIKRAYYKESPLKFRYQKVEIINN